MKILPDDHPILITFDEHTYIAAIAGFEHSELVARLCHVAAAIEQQEHYGEREDQWRIDRRRLHLLKQEAEKRMNQRDQAFESAKGLVQLLADIPCHCNMVKIGECVRCQVRRQAAAFFAGQ